MGATALPAAWAVAFGFAAAFAGDDVSDWFAFFALTGVAMVAGLWIERRSPMLGGLLIVVIGVAVGVLTFWAIFPPILALVLLGSWMMRRRRPARP